MVFAARIAYALYQSGRAVGEPMCSASTLGWTGAVAVRPMLLVARACVLGHRKRAQQIPQINPWLFCQIAGPILLLLQERVW